MTGTPLESPGAKSGAVRACAWCGSDDTTFVSRGYAGPTDDRDQYVLCHHCGKKTYEMIARTTREMRLGRYKPGDLYQDRLDRTRYLITRVLRVGDNEFLLYVKPEPRVGENAERSNAHPAV